MTREENRPREELSTADLAAAADRARTRDDRIVDERVIEQRVTQDAATRDFAEDEGQSLLATGIADELRERWSDIQAGFVDEPRRAVEQADGLVAEAIKRLAESFAEERSRLEGQWDRGDDVSTEDLRQALRRYRAFFSRLLSV